LSAEGIPTLATTIYTPSQALIAAIAGAKYVAPYVNRIDNLTRNGINVVAEINQLFSIYDLSSEILSASFKNLQQVHDVMLSVSHTLTLQTEIIKEMIYNPKVEIDINTFNQKWKNFYGNDCTSLYNT